MLLSLDTAGDNALFQLILEEGEQQQDRQRRRHNHGVLYQVPVVIGIRAPQEVFIIRGNLFDPQLQGPQILLVGHINGSLQPGVPLHNHTV